MNENFNSWFMISIYELLPSVKRKFGGFNHTRLGTMNCS